MKKAAVILCGCGAMDGSEIHESTFALCALDENGIEYQCYALDESQRHTINFTDGSEIDDTRNQMIEGARIARGNIKPLQDLQVSDYDYLVIPGGFGVAKNLCSFAFDGEKATINANIKRIIEEFHTQAKPIGAICIAPALIALALGGKQPIVTAGDKDCPAIGKFEALGCEVVPSQPTECVLDSQNKIVSTPAYMNAKTISQVRTGIYKLVDEIQKLS